MQKLRAIFENRTIFLNLITQNNFYSHHNQGFHNQGFHDQTLSYQSYPQTPYYSDYETSLGQQIQNYQDYSEQESNSASQL